MQYTTKVALATALFAVFIGFFIANTQTFSYLYNLISYCNVREFLVIGLGWFYICFDNNLVDIFINTALAYASVEVIIVFFDRICNTLKSA